MLSEEEIRKIKEQIILQIDTTFPEDKKTVAKEQINSMNAEELEQFINQNNLIKNNPNINPFRAIVEGQISSYIIDENQYAVAVLEINPISEGHVLIIPKSPLTIKKKIPKYL